MSKPLRAARRLTMSVAAALLLAAATGGSAAVSAAPRPDPDVDVLAYRFTLRLSDADDRIHGAARVRTRLLAPDVERLVLDLIGDTGETGMTVRSVRVDGAVAPFEHRDDRLWITLPPGAAREVRAEVEYDGVPADGLVISANRHGERTFFGDNWPDRGRHWLPLVDHVADKAVVEFVVIAPDHYQVVSNGRLLEETDLDDGTRLTHWRSDVALPPKVMVIGVARFAVQHLGTTAGVPLQSWVYPQDREAGFHDYAVARRVLAFFVDRIGPFPYAKLANVQSKTRFGGMENAGTIFYSERSISGDRSSEELIAHEIAHQWFGDSVTEADWADVWLSEGFATYFAALYNEATYGGERLRASMAASRGRVLAYARAQPERAVVQPAVDTLMQLLNANSYQKGGWVLHMLRRQIGDAAFWRGTRAYYARFRDRNASSEDLREVMETACDCTLSTFFEQWLHRPGQPELEMRWSWDEVSGRVRIEVAQRQPGAPFHFPLEIGIQRGDDTQRARFEVTGREARFEIDSSSRPDDVVLDPDVRLLHRDLGAGRE